MKMKHLPMLVCASGLIVLPACSSSPTTGDLMMSQGGDTKAMGEKWNKGNELIAEGHSDIKTGEKMIKKGNEKIDDGQEKIRKGTRMRNESEQEFKSSFPDGAAAEE